jgi:hypothetical protein
LVVTPLPEGGFAVELIVGLVCEILLDRRKLALPA